MKNSKSAKNKAKCYLKLTTFTNKFCLIEKKYKKIR